MQRGRLLEFLRLVVASPKVLKRDERGQWTIYGRFGRIYATPQGFEFLVATDGRPLKWAAIKKRLSFCELVQDGSV
jgi:hypothetical protein